ncbi:ATP-dependent DNA helicase Snf21 [Tilletia horrida]|nr:ATP-dependent DNA helicase Snf21 [Tilletia horrida]
MSQGDVSGGASGSTNVLAPHGNGSPANGISAGPSAPAGAMSNPGFSFSKEGVQQMVSRMHELRSNGATPENSPELLNILRNMHIFQNLQKARQGAAVHHVANGASPAIKAGVKSEPTPFKPEQLQTLQSQILAFKLLSHNQPLPEHVQRVIYSPVNGIKKEPADSALPQLREIGGPIGKVADSAIKLHNAVEALREPAAGSSTSDSPDKRPPSPVHDPSSSVYPYNAFTHPLTYLSNSLVNGNDLMASKQQRLLVPSLMPAGLNPHLLLEERNRIINARIQQRIRELESFPSNMSQRSTMQSLKGKDPELIQDEEYTVGDNAKLKAVIEYKALKLLGRQKALREQLVGSLNEAATLALDRTAFRRYKKQTLRDARMTEQLERKQRAEREKRVQSKHHEYLQSICNHGISLISAHRNVQSQAQRIGKAVLKLHADTEKEEQRRIERIAKERLNALKADDEEAYLKLIDTAKDTRIAHLVRQTDAYLDSLAQAVQAQQNDDVHADAIAAERAGLGPLPEDMTANQQIGIAVDETMFGARKDDDIADDKGKVDYYSVAHRISERVTEQPSILVGGKLKEYQLKGLQWMVSLFNNRLNGILADEMGLGKTIQTISLVTFLIERKRQPGPYLVIVPLSTLTNWINEFAKWAPSVTVIVYKGSPPARKALASQVRSGNFQVVLTTYEYIIKEKQVLGKVKWLHMIIDEGHRMKNTQSKLTVTLTQHYTSRYRLLLTGTPLQNNLPELWALLNFVLPRIFNSVKSFDEWFNTPFANTGTGENNMQLNEEEALLIIKRLHKVLRPFLLRRLKKDVESELPDKVEKVIKVPMSLLQLKMTQFMRKHKFIPGGDDIGPNGKPMPMHGNKGLQNKLMQLRKVCNHPYVFPAVEDLLNPMKLTGPDIYRVSGKFELLDRILPKMFATNHRCLIFFQMTQIMDIMEDFLKYRGYKFLRLDGHTKPDDRADMLAKFNAKDSEYFIFILSTRAGGLGLNLQTADTVIIYDSDWNPHQDLQAQDRAHRIGQKVEVRILRLVMEKSIEEQILARAQFKLEIDSKVIQAGKFDNQASAEDRDMLLRALLEDNGDEDEEERGDLNDDELNEILARKEEEKELFGRMDKEREAKEIADWKAAGKKGKPPPRLIQENELPTVYQGDIDSKNVSKVEEELPNVRKRTVINYDDGMTEDQWVRSVEAGENPEDVAMERRRRREAKRKRKESSMVDDDMESTPEPMPAAAASSQSQLSSKRGRPRKSAAANLSIYDYGDASPGPSGGRKRKRIEDSPDGGEFEEPSASGRRSVTGGGGAGKRRKPVQSNDEVRMRIREAMTMVYNALLSCQDGDRRRSDVFMDKPRKTMYPEYYVIIQKPIAMRDIKKKIDQLVYKTASQCRDDFLLMFTNARTFNADDSFVFIDAEELNKVFDKMFAKAVVEHDLPEAEEFGGSHAAAAAGAEGAEDVGLEAPEDDDDDEYDEAGAGSAAAGASGSATPTTAAAPSGSGGKTKLKIKMSRSKSNGNGKGSGGGGGGGSKGKGRSSGAGAKRGAGRAVGSDEEMSDDE